MKSLLPFVSMASEWVMLIDMDEFVFAHPMAGKGDTIKEVLMKLSKPSLIYLNWIMFGSSGHVEQPKSVRASFTRCGSNPSKNGKYIIHSSGLQEYHQHFPLVKKGTQKLFGCLLPNRDQCKDNTVLQINHYPLMSWNRFKNVKMTRGDVSESQYESIRNEDYFKNYDILGNETNCYELANLTRQSLFPKHADSFHV